MATLHIWRLPALLLMLGLIPIFLIGQQVYTMYQGMVHGVVLDDPADVIHIASPMPIALHMVAGLLFLVLGPFQMAPHFRARWPLVHRACGRIFVLAALFLAGTGLHLNAILPAFGGWAKYLGTMIFGVLMIVCVLRGLWVAIHGDIPRHRAWMIRCYAIGLATTTQAIIIAPLFAVWGMMDPTAILVAMWGGWALNLAMAEFIIQRRIMRPVPQGAWV